MKRTFTYALAAIFSAAAVVPAFAQSDNFPDVPDNHWAYEALANLKKAGVLVGYPDLLYHGSRPASRYELAVAINAAYTKLKGVTDGLDGQIKAINDKLGNYASQSDLQNLKDALAALQNDVNAMKGWGEDIANLKRLADTFQKELQSLGVDVEAMKKDLGDLADRVTKLEKRKPAVDISGDVNLWIGGGNSSDGFYGLDMDGRINGAQNPTAVGAITAANSAGSTNRAGLTQDLTILHEGAFTFAGTNDTGPKWKGTLVVGNMLGGSGTTNGFGDQSTTSFGQGYGEGNTDVYFQDFSVKFDTSVAGLAFNSEIGRVGYKVSPYIFQRQDNTSYFSNERWDNGLYYFDGGILGFNFGGAKLDVFGGLTPGNALGRSNGTSVQGTPIDPVQSGPFDGPLLPGSQRMVFNSELGANLNVPLSTSGNLNLAYLWLQDDNSTALIHNQNRLDVFGGSVDFNLGKLKVEGGYSQSDVAYNTTNFLTKDNKAYNGQLSYSGDKWGLWGDTESLKASTSLLATGVDSAYGATRRTSKASRLAATLTSAVP